MQAGYVTVSLLPASVFILDILLEVLPICLCEFGHDGDSSLAPGDKYEKKSKV